MKWTGRVAAGAMRIPQVVVFDMDGTLTEPVLDFDAIRAEIGVTGTLLEALAEMDPERHAAAMSVVERHEAHAARTAALRPWAGEVVRVIRDAGIPICVATRNSRKSAEITLGRHGLEFDYVDTREDGPAKPAPDPILRCCARVDASPCAAWMVGDYLYDVQCGRQAGAVTVLLSGQPHPDYAAEAEFVIGCLSELPGLAGLE